MSITILQSVLNGDIPLPLLVEWLNYSGREVDKEEFDVFQCTRSDFVIKFLSYIRKETETIISTNCNSALQNLHQNTPENLLQRRDSTSSLTSSSINFETPGNNSSKKHIQVSTLASGSKTNRLVKTKLFNDSDGTVGSNDSNLSTPLCEPMGSLQIKTTDHTSLVPKDNAASPTVKSDTTQHKINVSASESIIISSTPVKNSSARNIDLELTDHFPNSPITPSNSLSLQETPRQSQNSSRLTDPLHLKERTHDKSLTPISKSHTKTHTSLNKSINSERLNISLGDYIVSSSKQGKKKKSFKNLSVDSSVIKNHVSQNESGLDLSNIDMFPEIGAKKITPRQIKSKDQKRRIKPTSLNEKITTENLKNVESMTFKDSNFLGDSFKPNPIVLKENEAFKQQKFQPKEESRSFDIERSILKKDRHKLMEKFNVLNTATNSVKITQSSPKIQIIKRHKKISETYIEPDVNHVEFTSQLDSLVNIYDALLNANLVLNISTEIFFLISLCVSQQTLKDYNCIDSKSDSKSSSFNSDNFNNKNANVPDINTTEFLRSIHNCLYFSVKMLWKQRFVLKVMLDKHSLRLLGENKRVRTFLPELTKFLLNEYCLKYESEVLNSRRDLVSANVLESRFAGDGNVCFNSETDNVDNFPTGQSFSNFRKQRDIFYELLGFWEKGGRGSRLQQKVKELMHLAITPANRAHLARLLRDHILAECTQSLQETKLTKLTRRLTGPAPVNDNQKTPKFSGREAFYREVLELADSDAFRSHVRDCFSTELVNIDNSTHTTYQDKIIESSTEEAERKLWHLCTVRKCRALAKFLGLTVSLPYMTVSNTASNANGRRTDVDKDGRPLKEKVLANELTLREQTQPPLNLNYLLQNSYQSNRLSITIPWLVQYLAMLDYTSLRLKYYSNLLKILFQIYLKTLKVVGISNENQIFLNEIGPENSKSNDNIIKNSTRVLLNLCLGSLFELPHFPQQLFYDWLIEMSFECERDIFAVSSQKINVNQKILNSLTVETKNEIEVSDLSLDFEDLADENLLSEICPQLKDIGVILMHWNQQSGETSRESSGPTFRHITPVTMSFDATDKVKNKEKELQARLEEQFVRSQAPWTRRVLELVSERAASAVCRDLTAQHLPEARLKAKKETLELLAQRNSTKKVNLEQQIQHIYEQNLTSLRDRAYKEAPVLVRGRAAGALDALLAAAVPRAPLIAAASKAGVARVERWIRDNWQTTDILKKDIKSEVERYLVLNQDIPSSQPLETGRDVEAITAPSDEFEAKNLSPACIIMEIRDLICKSLMGEIISIQNLWLVLQRTNICCMPTNLFITAHSKLMLFQLSVDLVVCVAGTSPHSLTDETIDNFGKIWDLCCPNRPKVDFDESLNLPERREDLSPEPRNFVEEENMSLPSTPEDVVIPPDGITKIVILDEKTCEDIPVTTKNDNTDSESKGLLVFFERILCPRNMAILTEVRNHTDPKPIWSAVAKIMLYLLKNRFLTQNSLTEQCLAVYRQDWPQPVLDLVAGCMRQVSHSWGHPRDTKFTLFLDFLAEYCNNMDVEINQEHNIDSDLQFSLE